MVGLDTRLRDSCGTLAKCNCFRVARDEFSGLYVANSIESIPNDLVHHAASCAQA